MSDTYQALALAVRRAVPVWAEVPGYGVGYGMGTQADVAAHLGCSQATASRILSGRLSVTLPQLCALAEARAVTLAQLLAQLEPWAHTTRACPDCNGQGCATCKGSGARWWDVPGGCNGPA